MKTTNYIFKLEEHMPMTVRVFESENTILFYVMMEEVRTDQHREWFGDLFERLVKPHHTDARIRKIHRITELLQADSSGPFG